MAINSRNVSMVRKLETRAQFASLLLMKVPKWANLGTEWKQRYAARLVHLAFNLATNRLSLMPQYSLQVDSSFFMTTVGRPRHREAETLPHILQVGGGHAPIPEPGGSAGDGAPGAHADGGLQGQGPGCARLQSLA